MRDRIFLKPPKRTDHPEDLDACYAAAIRLLDVRWHARRELDQKLALRGFAPATIGETTSRLETEGWIDDRRFAEEYVRSRSQRKVARRRIEIELEHLGVTREIVRDALAASFDVDADASRLLEMARRKAAEIVRRHGNAVLRGEVGRRKLSQALLRRGYDGSAVAAAIGAILDEYPNENEND